jgi:ribosomal protein S18 acetylase RimI-like enzyme
MRFPVADFNTYLYEFPFRIILVTRHHNDSINIRPQVAEDISYLKDIFLEAQKTMSPADPDSIASKDFERDTKDEFIIVAVEEIIVNNVPVTQVIGFISLWLPENFIHHLYIRSDYHRRGIGAMLLRSALEKMDGAAHLKCLVANPNAIAFYKSQHFKETDTGLSADGPYIQFKFP